MFNHRKEQYMDDPAFPFRAFPGYVTETIDSHTHEFMELVFVKEGSGGHQIAGKETGISEGDVYIVEPEADHAYFIRPGHGVTVYNVIFDPALIAKELEVLNIQTPIYDFLYLDPFLRQNRPFHSHLKISGGNRIRVCQMIESLMEEDRMRELGYQIYIKMQLIQLLIFLSRCFAAENRSRHMDNSDETARIDYACDFIARHFTLPLTLEQLCSLCGMGATSFTDKFKRRTGYTFIEYRNRLRLEWACSRLQETDGKIVDIAMNAGFDDISHFNRLFKAVYGASPKAWRSHGAASGQPPATKNEVIK